MAAGAALLVVPLIKVAGITGATVEQGQPSLMHRPADPVLVFFSHKPIAARAATIIAGRS